MKTVVTVVAAVLTVSLLVCTQAVAEPAFTEHTTTAGQDLGRPGALTHTGHFKETANGVTSHAHDQVADPTGAGNFGVVGVTNGIAGKEINGGSGIRSGSGVQPK